MRWLKRRSKRNGPPHHWPQPSNHRDMLWNRNDLLLVGGAYVNVILGLAVVYVNLAIYNYIFGLVDSLSKWLQSPTLPVSMKNK